MVTKYDPEHRRASDGGYAGPEPPVSDHGSQEAAYLQAVLEFAVDANVSDLVVRDPELGGINFGLVQHVEGYGLPIHLGMQAADFYDGARLPLAVAVELVRAMLRDNGLWCRLEVDDAFTVHIGYDQYMYIGTRNGSGRAQAAVEALGLFVEDVSESPYAVDRDSTTPSDDES